MKEERYKEEKKKRKSKIPETSLDSNNNGIIHLPEKIMIEFSSVEVILLTFIHNSKENSSRIFC